MVKCLRTDWVTLCDSTIHICQQVTMHCTAIFFDILLTVHLSITLVINQLDAQNLVL